jgi:hypothetical protein
MGVNGNGMRVDEYLRYHLYIKLLQKKILLKDMLPALKKCRMTSTWVSSLALSLIKIFLIPASKIAL